MTLRRLRHSIGGGLLTALLIFTPHIAAQTPPLTLTTLHSFTGGPGDGWGPFAGVTIGAGGVLYGSTTYGGSSFKGTAFSLIPPASLGGTWTESVYSFPGGRTGSAPTEKLVVVPGSHVLVGTTLDPASGGSVFSLHPPASAGGAWAERVLYEFTDYPTQGQDPDALTIGGGGVLYGTTSYGGNGPCDEFDPGCGTVFSLTPPASTGGAWTETLLHSFAGYPSDGSEPDSNLIVGSGGVLYGTTLLGGANDTGTVYSLTPPSSPGGPWTETVLYSFPPLLYGYQPGALVIGSGGVLFGTTLAGGIQSSGTVFTLIPPASPGSAWREADLHSFSGGPTDGAFPNSLVIGSGGVLYGATGGGGPAGAGTLFSLTTNGFRGNSWTEAVLYSFTGGSDGATPNGVVIGSGGILYGTTHGGGISNFGTVFSFTP